MLERNLLLQSSFPVCHPFSPLLTLAKRYWGQYR